MSYQRHELAIIKASADQVKENQQPGLLDQCTGNSAMIQCPSFSTSVHLVAHGYNLNIRVLKTIEELEKLHPSWEQLLSQYPQASIFSTWEWLAPWWRAFGSERQLHVLAFEDSSSQLVGLAPLSISIRTDLGKNWKVLRLMGDGSGDSDNLDLPVRMGYEDTFTVALVDYLDKRIVDWDFCEFNTMPSYSPVGNRLRSVLHQRGWHGFDYNRVKSDVQLPATWESYLKQLSAKERGKLGTRSRRLERRYRVRFHKCSEASEIPASLDNLFRLHQEHWLLRGHRGSFLSPARQSFYEEISRLFHARQWLELWLLNLDGKCVAAQFGFRYGETFFSLQEGFDPDHASDSVGYVLRGHVIRQLISAGVRRYDFLAGQGPDKTRWGAQLGNYVDIHFARPYSLGSLFLHAVVGTKNTKEWLRAHIPRSLWALLHRLNLLIRGWVRQKGHIVLGSGATNIGKPGKRKSF